MFMVAIYSFSVQIEEMGQKIQIDVFIWNFLYFYILFLFGMR